MSSAPLHINIICPLGMRTTVDILFRVLVKVFSANNYKKIKGVKCGYAVKSDALSIKYSPSGAV